jgi:hypothetical protein
VPRDFFRVRDLDKRQHYSNRNPPWIKLHTERLEDPDFANLPDNTKAHLLLIELLASRMENRLPLDERFIRSRINARSAVNLSLLLNQGFIERIASAPQAEGEQPATPEREQRRGETEGEQREREIDARAARVVEAVPVELALVPTERPALAPKKRPTATAATIWTDRVVALHLEMTGGVITHGKAGGILKPLVDVHGFDAVEPALRAFYASQKRQYGLTYFAEHYCDFTGQAAGFSPRTVQTLQAGAAWASEGNQ